MIKVNIVTVWVGNQDEALAFYTEKLGFKVHTDAKMGTYRWLTVTPPEQPDLEVLLSEPGGPQMDEATAATMRSLIAKGALFPGVLSTDDCRRTYAELRERGVEFTQEPIDRFYGTDAAFRDPFGNSWRMTQPKEITEAELEAARKRGE
jgi:catechol 2,3-dioxygenase-like lactoylglutathione lyase family enzyme